MRQATLLAMLGLCIPWIFAGCGAPPEPETACFCVAGGSWPTAVIDDRARQSALSKACNALVKSKNFTSAEELTKQLTRKSCQLALPVPSARPLTPQRVYAQRRDSVLVVSCLYKCPNCTRWHNSYASGFLIDASGVFVTNYHVMANQAGRKRHAYVAMTFDKKVYPVKEILAADKQSDLAIVRLDLGDKPPKVRPVPLATGTSVGAPVVVLAHPGQRYYTLTAGMVSRYYRHRRGNRTVTMMSITADYGVGASGGPVLDSAGNVVGVVSSTSPIAARRATGKDGKQVQQSIQMVVKQCVPVAAIKAMIKKP